MKAENILVILDHYESNAQSNFRENVYLLFQQETNVVLTSSGEHIVDFCHNGICIDIVGERRFLNGLPSWKIIYSRSLRTGWAQNGRHFLKHTFSIKNIHLSTTPQIIHA